MRTQRAKFREYKKELLDKFGSLRNFAQAAGLDYRRAWTLVNEFLNEELLLELINKTPEPKINTPIPDELIKEIDEEIKKQYGNRRKFCLKHKEFTEGDLSYLINGKRGRMTEKINKLREILEI